MWYCGCSWIVEPAGGDVSGVPLVWELEFLVLLLLEPAGPDDVGVPLLLGFQLVGMIWLVVLWLVVLSLEYSNNQDWVVLVVVVWLVPAVVTLVLHLQEDDVEVVPLVALVL